MTMHPPISCPDCGGLMYLTDKPSTWDGGSRVIYLCENRPNGCRGLMSAHPDGRPCGTPADAETRRARRIVHDQAFDRLWQNAPAMYSEGDSGRPSDAALRRIAKVRAYKWLSEKAGIPFEKCHMSMMDIEQLRLVWRTIRDHNPTPESIRAWARERKQKK